MIRKSRRRFSDKIIFKQKLAGLLDDLLMRGILRPVEVTDILDNAHRQLSANSDITPVADAMDIVSKLRTTYQDIEQITS